MSQAEEQGLSGAPTVGHLKSVLTRTHVLPAFLVLTVMMVALWLMGMPFLQALTISTGVKIAVALLAFRPRAPQEPPA
ncbi:hypothetical protein [Streptomyces sp. NPDC058157]|uniref:hypothetical protein n=1 Tax=Streptomyces sp. NPDC058157 TaxID=3346360 RepID=UPI0036E1520B